MRRRFEGAHVLVTGAARGIGLEIARQFGREGARLALLDVDGPGLERAAAALRGEGIPLSAHEADVSDRGQVQAAVERAEAIAPIGILINNAGIAAETPFLAITEAEWRRIIDVNLTGMFHVAQAVCARMAERRRGVVVNMASTNGLEAESGYAHYNASKGGVILLTRTMALELAPLNIRVNAVCPGFIRTPLSREIMSDELVQARAERYIPQRRTGTPEEVAALFLFLASEESTFITGQAFVVDGGQMAGLNPVWDSTPCRPAQKP